VAEWLSKQK